MYKKQNLFIDWRVWHKEMLSIGFTFVSIDVSETRDEVLANAREALHI